MAQLRKNLLLVAADVVGAKEEEIRRARRLFPQHILKARKKGAAEEESGETAQPESPANEAGNEETGTPERAATGIARAITPEAIPAAGANGSGVLTA